MKVLLYPAASALALAGVPAAAQMTMMPGMTMPAAKKPVAHKPATSKPANRPVVHPAPAATPPADRPAAMPGMDEKAMDAMPGMEPVPPVAAPAPKDAMSGMAGMEGMEGMAGMDHGAMGMPAALGPYPGTREASGTSWQPDASNHQGLMTMSGGWHLMAHGVLNLVADHQGGPRGADKLFASGMLMGMAEHPLGNGSVQFKAMLSPDPLMGPRGYPLLLASGETADGVTRLVDRQHPHDLFMELSASVSQNIGRNRSLFLYGGLPGEPAFGPPAFMHRESILDSPEAPISHHWLDSTHISFGVLTAGLVLDRVKLEVSRFNAREPDQHRFDIETGPLDSTAVRLSWNPTAELSLQGSWGYFKDPEQLEPGVDQKRLSASAIYTRQLGPDTHWATTIAFGRKTIEHHSDDAYVLESSLRKGWWTAFGRAEMTQNRELSSGSGSGPANRVGKASLGAVRDVPVARHLSLGVGGLVSVNFLPAGLATLYGGPHPLGAMGFVRMKLN